jgi:hypothetical protein
MERTPPDESTQEIVGLTGQQRLVVQRSPTGDLVQFLSRDGAVALTVTLTDDGPVLRFEGASLVLQAAGKLAIEADELVLRGQSGVSIGTAGDLELKATGDLHSEARIQTVTATRGDVKLRANDDVTMVGERIRMNC